MGEHLRYERPPLREMTCEFRFAASGWDAAIPGLLFVALKDRFPKRQTVHQVGITADGEKQPAERFQIIQLLRFQQEDGLGFVQVAPHTVSISRLAPYPGWPSMKPIIEHVFSAYTAQAKPEKLTRIGLRYLNDFQFDDATMDPEEYFNFHPTVGPSLPQNYTDLQSSVVLILDSGRGLRLQLHGIPAIEPAKTALRLDLDIFNGVESVPPIDDSLAWVDSAHSELRGVFESSLKPQARELFGHTQVVQ